MTIRVFQHNDEVSPRYGCRRWICIVIETATSIFSPSEWKDPKGFSRDSCAPSIGVREVAFAAIKEATDAALRARLNREYLRREGAVLAADKKRTHLRVIAS
jgi:hypothetical protein